MQIERKKTFSCPLCGCEQSELYLDDGTRIYHQCPVCWLVFVLPEFILPLDQEKQIYDYHENNEYDEGYRQFLSRLIEPLCEKIPASGAGLDFGCGPGPVLVKMLQERGYSMSKYDIFYAPDEISLQRQYDFITCTEVVEHLSQPGKELTGLLQLLAPDGWLGIMTKLVRDLDAFRHWHYKNDPTHICFFSRDTFDWLAGRQSLSCEYVGTDVILLRKSR